MGEVIGGPAAGERRLPAVPRRRGPDRGQDGKPSPWTTLARIHRHRPARTRTAPSAPARRVSWPPPLLPRAQARTPDTCGKRQRGPRPPADRGLQRVQATGIIYRAKVDEMNHGGATSGVAGVDYTGRSRPAPACHMSAAREARARPTTWASCISWTLRPPISAKHNLVRAGAAAIETDVPGGQAAAQGRRRRSRALKVAESASPVDRPLRQHEDRLQRLPRAERGGGPLQAVRRRRRPLQRQVRQAHRRRRGGGASNAGGLHHPPRPSTRRLSGSGGRSGTYEGRRAFRHGSLDERTGLYLVARHV
ncbi:MAG: hypothetical protein MZW92_50295 [Comamonadaceae bacterium]|nr:hypothetical protein [Comamonadaceae bacterium]